jgi:hypothetical protein
LPVVAIKATRFGWLFKARWPSSFDGRFTKEVRWRRQKIVKFLSCRPFPTFPWDAAFFVKDAQRASSSQLL